MADNRLPLRLSYEVLVLWSVWYRQPPQSHLCSSVHHLCVLRSLNFLSGRSVADNRLHLCASNCPLRENWKAYNRLVSDAKLIVGIHE